MEGLLHIYQLLRETLGKPFPDKPENALVNRCIDVAVVAAREVHMEVELQMAVRSEIFSHLKILFQSGSLLDAHSWRRP